MRPESPLSENKRLQRCIGDLVSVMALPAMWAGREPCEIARSLLDSVLGMLELDFVHLRLNDENGDASFEITQLSPRENHMVLTEQLKIMLTPFARAEASEWPRRTILDGNDITVHSMPLGLFGEIGLLVAGSRRPDFPTQTEGLVLNVAANQATIGLQAAWQLDEQKRLAGELDRRVEARTRELAHANKELQSSEWNLRHLTETIPQMLWSAKPDGTIDYCNARLLDFTGFAATEIMGDGWRSTIHPDDYEQVASTWLASVSTGMPYRMEARLIHAGSSSYRWCLTTALPLHDEAEKILKWYGVCVDMHDWKSSQDELRETQAELAHITRVMTMGQLTASIAHELNQPLAGIMTNAGTALRMLTAEPPNIDGARKTARRTIRDAKRASDVITRLRALFTKGTTASEVVDLNAATREIIALSLSKLQTSGVNLRVELAENLPQVVGDRVQFQQVILNLIMNATDSMLGVTERPKELLVSTEVQKDGYVRVTIKDAGEGFDPAATDKLFSPFYTTKMNGMGIGLSVSRTIVENHHGRLWAAHNNGFGSTFCFAIPSKSVAETANTAAQIPPSHPLENTGIA